LLKEDFTLEPKKVFEIVELHKSSDERTAKVNAMRYYVGDNVGISNARKVYYSDAAGRVTDNPYKSNAKIGYGFFGDMVDQCVFTILDEPPQIIPKNEDEDVTFLTDALGDNFGNTLQRCAIQAQVTGGGYIHKAFDYAKKMVIWTVFKSANSIEFVDAITGEAVGYYRYWELQSQKGTNFLIVEVYDGKQRVTYKRGNDKNIETVETVGHKERRVSYGGIVGTVENLSTNMPIKKLNNNEDETSSLSQNILSKIDAIDITLSDFLNNLIDFADVFWSIKGDTAAFKNWSKDQQEDFIKSITRTKTIVAEGGADAITIQIPHEARKALADMLKEQLMREAGVIDYAAIGGVTATAIRVATHNLKQRISKFEYWLNKTTRELIDMVLEDLGRTDFEYTLVFNKNYPDNIRELIETMEKVSGDMSRPERRTILQRVGLIEKVEEIEEEIEPAADEGGNPDEGMTHNPESRAEAKRRIAEGLGEKGFKESDIYCLEGDDWCYIVPHGITTPEARKAYAENRRKGLSKERAAKIAHTVQDKSE
jgi:SPP1 family phage portal protein